MSDIQEEQKRQYKKAKENDIKKILKENDKLFKEKVELINLIINIDYQCYCAKFKTLTINHISKMIKEYMDKYKKEK